MQITLDPVSGFLLSIIAYFLKRAFDRLDALELSVNGCKESIAILIDRDRRKRLRDYDAETAEV